MGTKLCHLREQTLELGHIQNLFFISSARLATHFSAWEQKKLSILLLLSPTYSSAFFPVLRSAAWNEEVCYFSVVHELTVQERTLLNGQEGTRHEEAARVHKAMNQTLNFERIFLNNAHKYCERPWTREKTERIWKFCAYLYGRKSYPN